MVDTDVDQLLEMNFNDELSAHRAKRHWKEVFYEDFLLDDQDYTLTVFHRCEQWVLRACFDSACGRYAYWKMKNNDNPEAVERLSKYV